MTAPFLAPKSVAVVTGAASGIGRAACLHFAERGMRIVLADADRDRLDRAAAAVTAIAGPDNVSAVALDVADAGAVEALADDTFERFGQVDLLMNNAAARVAGGDREDLEEWHRTMDVNFWAAVHAERAFLPRMLLQGTPAAIVNTGSKQGITNPPGNLIYNVTKSALKTYTEGLQHQLRNVDGCKVSAHLLVPGWTNTGERPPHDGAWMPEQVVDRLIAALEAGDFYVICPDNEVTSEMDARRILWAAGDMTENRPPLSRWHPGWKDKFS
ncbi:SDR family NAD(P)-dependent oxidoreductase [Roseisalinus antarcticus]|uniref:1-deoxy-11-beta-hydroxypentalenate dehydrogenase n=1 Tax=Roseisalinus antarcticus TaxID=254357 RepID=A0A1Y5SMA6_9RHOB|nr:SDR family NAD(P)-dependent oxidoreductase [Roseisalinus antarcticus]SLN43834.1 1-deoxy-11-beta-hydroxypentalenate dehydrogenase [Roseisalinus antarcticus]